MPDPDYTAWPIAQDVQDLLDGCGVALRLTGAAATRRMARAIPGVTREVAKVTKRQFVADAADASRYYDGNGLPRLQVDEMVSLTGVQIIGVQSAPGFTLDATLLESKQNEPQTWLVVGKGSLPAFATAGVYLPWPQIFPAGRLNIYVTGKFGYGAAIPEDLWEAVAAETAYRLACEVGYRPTGRIARIRTGETQREYRDDKPEITGWHDLFTAALKRYKRRAPARVQRRPGMI